MWPTSTKVEDDDGDDDDGDDDDGDNGGGDDEDGDDDDDDNGDDDGGYDDDDYNDVDDDDDDELQITVNTTKKIILRFYLPRVKKILESFIAVYDNWYYIFLLNILKNLLEMFSFFLEPCLHMLLTVRQNSVVKFETPHFDRIFLNVRISTLQFIL